MAITKFKKTKFKKHLKFFVYLLINIIDHTIIRIKNLFGVDLPKIIIEDKEDHITCGYYDITPFNKDETKLLATKFNHILRTPEPGKLAKVGYYILSKDHQEFIELGQTNTWNWQQGCRLQWYPSSNENRIFYNVLLEDHYGSVVQNLDTSVNSRTIDYPIYELGPFGKLGLTLNFSRLQRLRPGYGYVNLPDPSQHELAPRDDGIWLVDIENNQAKLLFSLAELAQKEQLPSMVDAQHYINHLSFNPSGTDFLFFHLWVEQNNHRHSRLFTATTDSDRLTLLNNAGPVSHYTWLSDEELVVTTRIAENQFRYIQYHCQNGFEGIIGNLQLTRDGHPTFVKDNKFLLTDTYPNRIREQELMVYNLVDDKITIVERFFSPRNFSSEVRCDLHPRPSPSSNLVCIDFVRKNRRALKIIDISKIINSNQ